ncbi:hypothetical protein Mgra_00009768 [Meloidogyne graminicola]|uniref:Uncharacterized protein n=1 Tax=Meloidogyne graminicola TaxID=189291 RepID=A0A8S9Z6Z1_9BILA|nr:hypothetical protein Mgra_00009768 [Meloidogyne graminicola]
MFNKNSWCKIFFIHVHVDSKCLIIFNHYWTQCHSPLCPVWLSGLVLCFIINERMSCSPIMISHF